MRKLLDRLLERSKADLCQHPQRHCHAHWTYLVIGRRIICEGVNKAHEPPIYWGYHNKSDDFRPKWHAESNAIHKAKRYYGRCDVVAVNVRLNRRGEVRLAKPCPVCLRHLLRFGCRRIYFTTKSGWGHLADYD